MSLCKGANLTLIVKVLEMKGIIDIEGNRITGQYGKVLDLFLETKGERDCKLVGILEFGKQFPNLSYNGALGLLEAQKGDLYLTPSTQYLLKDFLEQSGAVLSEKYMVGHRIELNKRSKEVDVINLLTDFEIYMKFILMMASLIFIITLILISYLSTSKFKINKLLSNFFQFKNNFKYPVSIIGLSLLFYHLFYFIFKAIISNQINASIVIVDTSYIVNSMEKLLETENVVCWIKNDVEIRMAEQSPKGSDMLRLFNEKKYSTPVKDMEDEESYHCLLSLKPGQTFDFENKILFINEPALYGFLATFLVPNPDIAYWITSDPIMEMISVYYYRNGLTYTQKNVINNNNHLKLQSGMSQYSYDLVIYNTKKMITASTKIYTNLNDYIEDQNLFVKLQFSFLRRVFILYFFINILAASSFLAIHWHSKSKSYMKTFRSRKEKF